jgi:hypothetical protein
MLGLLFALPFAKKGMADDGRGVNVEFDCCGRYAMRGYSDWLRKWLNSFDSDSRGLLFCWERLAG